MVKSITVRCPECFIRTSRHDMEQIGRHWYCKDCAKELRNKNENHSDR